MPDDELRFDQVRFLLVDDEPNHLRLVRRILLRRGAVVESAINGRDGLAQHEQFQPDIIVTDLRMPELSGLEMLRQLRESDDETIVIVLTGFGAVDSAKEAMRLGASDYLMKPCDMEELMLVADRELRSRRVRHENQRLRSELSTLSRRLGESAHYAEMIGRSPAMQEVYRQVERLCWFHDMPVLITGETGTGKELVARALHHGSPRAARPFIAINCGAVPTDLQESQLFGHRQGSFTGASADHTGAFQAAEGGTLLLDEVGEMRSEMQVKLLRALEEKAITPLGQNDPIPVDVRVLAATNRDLAEAVADGSFRADLYNRIEGVVINLPPLRARREDIPLLAEHFLRAVAEEYKVQPKRFSPEALERLIGYFWPGNVRELQNVVRRAFVFSGPDVIAAEDLEYHPPSHASRPVVNEPAPSDPVGLPTLPPDEAEESLGLGLLERQERRLIRQALEEAQGNKSKAAEMLGIDRKRLYRKIERYELS